MSHKFAVDKNPKGITYHVQVHDSSKFRKHWTEPRPQDSVSSKRKPISSCCIEDEGDRADRCCHYRPPDIFPSKPEKISQKNIFIDSYYPKLLEDFSEECSRKSYSSQAESQKGWTEDASESDGRKTYDPWDAICDRENFKDKDSKKSDGTTIHKSSRSRMTLNCNTYTLISINSDLESISSRKNLHTPERVRKMSDQCSDEQREVTETTEDDVEGLKPWPKEEKVKCLSDSTEGGLSTTDCFTHLYTRIENLEDLLQESLVPVDECKVIETPETKQKPPRVKNKFVLPKTTEPKEHLSYTHKVREASGLPKATRVLEHSDTENELWNIRKRLNALEKKLKDAHNSVVFLSLASADNDTVINETCLVKSNGRPEMYDTAKLKESDSADKMFSQATFVVPSDFFIISNKPRKKREKVLPIPVVDKERRKKITKSKKIKRKASSIYSSRRKTFRPKKPYIKINDRSIRGHSNLKVKSSQSIIYNVCKENESSTLLDDSKPEEKIILIEKPKKKHRSKRNKLCKKTSITNIVMTQGEQNRQNDRRELIRRSHDATGLKKNVWTLSQTKLQNNWPSCSCYMTLSTNQRKSPHKSFTRKNFQYNWEPEKTKKPKTKYSDPVEILKSGGKIKIPVLFEEVCSPRSKALERNLSDISMRFVMVQEDPKNPLRKLIKKINQNATPATENYLFGVSKCSCNNQDKAGGQSGRNEWLPKTVYRNFKCEQSHP